MAGTLAEEVGPLLLAGDLPRIEAMLSDGRRLTGARLILLQGPPDSLPDRSHRPHHHCCYQ